MKTVHLAAALLIASFASPATADPTAQVAGGYTSVRLSEEFVGALGSLGVTPGDIEPGRLSRGRARFPIPGGALDLETARGDIFHLGGLTLVAGDTRVGLLNFVIDTTADPLLTGLVTVDGDLVGRVPLFDLGLTEAPSVRHGRLKIRDVDVTLTAAAAGALNDIFGVSDFFDGLPIGTAKLKTHVLGDDDGDDDDDDDD
jgi:hypothetical protein